MLGEFTDHRRVFIEVTKTSHQHGGPGWEFGTCLWSPSLNKVGHDIYRLMREPELNDLVLHILEHEWEPGVLEQRFAGRSFVGSSYESRKIQPPLAGEWANQSPYYRIPLGDYVQFPEPISLGAFVSLYDRELRTDLRTQPTYYPFTLYAGGSQVRLRQGGYLNLCTPALFNLLRIALGEGPTPPGTAPELDGAPVASADREFKEARRIAGERYAFARNPALVRAARAQRGYTCEACGFNFEATYGPVGKGYVECHHVDPLGSREEPTTSTRVADVRMLCANCHRMVHRERPAMSVEQLRSRLRRASEAVATS